MPEIPDVLMQSMLKGYRLYLLPVVTTVSTTCTSCIHIDASRSPPGCPSSVLIFCRDDEQIAAEANKLWLSGYRWTYKNISRTESLHQARLSRAKATLIQHVLPNPIDPDHVHQVISEVGIALNEQVDLNPVASSCASNDINSKLTALGMFAGSPLYEKHRRLNRFYNATKHARTVDNQNCRLRLASRDGRRIAVDYFETVRRIFRWYYRKYAAGIPDWDELKPISYRDHGFSYRFKHSDRW
jgi:hypothetical protein